MEMNNYLNEMVMFYCANSKETASNYRRIAKEFCAYTMEQRGWNINELIKQANKRDVLMYVKELEDRGLSPYSINFYISVVSTFFKFLTDFDYRDKTNPCDTVQRVNTQGIEQKQEYLEEYEYKALLQVIKTREGRQRKFEFTSSRDVLWCTLCLSVGLRAFEALSLKVEQFNSDIITIKGKGNKTRSFKITEEIREAFNEYMKVRNTVLIEGQEDEGFVFISVTGKQLATKDINKNLKKYASRANIYKELSSHALRRSCATHYLNEGVPVAKVAALLGHSDVKTTMLYYKEDGSNFDFLGL